MPATAQGKGQIATQQIKSKPEQGARWQPTAEERADLTAIDTAIERMRALTAPDPYVLTIPQDVEPRYHHSYRSQAQQWLCNAPFSPNEHESLQYQTFHFYEHGKQIYVQQNSRPQEPKATAGEPRSQRPGTGANTPTPAPKKKISLDAYKKKQSGLPSTPDVAPTKKGADANAAKQSALKGPSERVKAETEEMLAAVAESEAIHAPIQKSGAQPEKKDLKRKREEKEAIKMEDIPPKQDKHSEAGPRADQPVATKMRRSPSPAHQSARASKPLLQTSREPKARPREECDETKLPPRLSPGMPPRLSPLRHPSSPKSLQNDVTPPLPPMLSPTIPENITNTLKARDLYYSGSKDENATRKADEASKRRSPIPRNGFRANSSSPAIRSDAEDKLRPVTVLASKRPRSPGLSQNEDVGGAKVVTDRKPPSLLVRLRYKKSQKEGIARILKTRPTPTKRASSPTPAAKTVKEHKQDEKSSGNRNGERKDDRAGKTVAQKTSQPKKEGKLPQHDTSNRTTTAEKRPLLDEDRTVPSAKRRELNASDSRKEPSTPARPTLPSPVANSSVQKGQLPPTPNTRKDVLSQSMRREFSQESFTMNTPPAMSATPNMNGSHSHTNGHKRPPGSQPSVKTPIQQAWETEQKRYEVLGRELKHAASSQSTGDATSSGPSHERTISAFRSLESLICYFYAFTCTDEAANQADPKQHPSVRPWRSMQGLYGFVKRKCDGFPVLSGLVSSLGVSLNSHIISLIVHQPIDTVDTEALVHANRALLRAVSEVNVKLNIDILQRDLQVTWGNAIKSELPPVLESTDPARLLYGPYKLPIDMLTAPFRAARAAHAGLQELVEQMGLEYEHTLVM